MNNKLYTQIIHNIAYSVKKSINEAKYKDHDSEHAATMPIKRVQLHYCGLAQNKYAASKFGKLQRLNNKTVAHIHLKQRFAPAWFNGDDVWIRCYQRQKDNPDTFQIKLNQNLTDILITGEYDNALCDPNKSVNYLAFLNKDTDSPWDDNIEVYIIKKDVIMDVVNNLKERSREEKIITRGERKGETYYKKINNKSDRYHNILKFEGRMPAIVLTNDFIYDEKNLTDRFCLGLGDHSDFNLH